MGQSQPKTTTIEPRLIQQITRPRDFRALADQINRYREEAQSSMGDIERMSGTPADIGAHTAGAFERAAASYLSSLPTADKYIQATTGLSDPYAPARESAQSYLDFTKDLSQEAKETSSSYEPPAFTPQKFSWEDLPAPGNKPKDKQKNRKAGQAFTA